MHIKQYEIILRSRPRGFHLITREILDVIGDDLSGFTRGLCHVFIQHTSAGLAINENADPDVRLDFETHFNRMVPEDTSLYRHTLEGTDDMTSHIKSSILGHELTIPVTRGRLNLGTWQGIYLCEHRNAAGGRRLVVTITGN
ncbi:MAG: YjbQ family protein [Bacteroidetes bacterium]|nr:YjbQ family protein [Bacteroidota bacterium]MCH8525099.1 secondary thiamine-phosphate synthase enzyme YjbQ [Balneolales bacterium]